MAASMTARLSGNIGPAGQSISVAPAALNHDARHAPMEGVEAWHQPLRGEKRGRADGHDSLVERAELRRRVLENPERRPHRAKIALPYLGQHDAARATLEELGAERLLELLNVKADGAARYMEFSRRLAKAQMARRSLEGAQRVEWGQ
jgi:predicted DNA-binding protein (UPF0251 family)